MAIPKVRRLVAVLALLLALVIPLLAPAGVAAHGATDYSPYCRTQAIYYGNNGYGKFYDRDLRTGWSHISGNDYIYYYDHQHLNTFGPWEWWEYQHSYACRNYDWMPPTFADHSVGGPLVMGGTRHDS